MNTKNEKMGIAGLCPNGGVTMNTEKMGITDLSA